MTRRNRLMTTLLTLATAASTASALACPRGGHGGGYYRPAPVYQAAPVYHAAPRVVQYSPTASNAQATAQAAVRQARAAADQATAAARVRAAAAQAKAAFLARNYGTALSLVDQIVKVAPNNNEALQFRSLIRFAMDDYKLAAADAYEALKFGPVWDKSSLGGLYGDLKIYERQLKALKTAAAEQPEAMDLHFLLAYQMLLSGDLAGGQKELETVLTIKPAEPMTENLLKLVKDVRAKQATTVAAETR